MGSIKGSTWHALLLALTLYACTACVRADAARKRFDIPEQPAAAALNEFARQADIAILFSYDLVASTRTRRLQGSYTVPDGLTRLLAGTVLDYRLAGNGAYIICRLPSCGAWSYNGDKEAQADAEPGSGKPQLPRLHDTPRTTRER